MTILFSTHNKLNTQFKHILKLLNERILTFLPSRNLTVPSMMVLVSTMVILVSLTTRPHAHALNNGNTQSPSSCNATTRLKLSCRSATIRASESSDTSAERHPWQLSTCYEHCCLMSPCSMVIFLSYNNGHLCRITTTNIAIIEAVKMYSYYQNRSLL